MAMWCGPSAVAAIVNKPYEDIKKVFDKVCLRPVEGTSLNEMQLSLHRLGINNRVLNVDNPSSKVGYPWPKVLEWYARQSMANRCLPMVVGVTGHWISIQYGMVKDNVYLKPTPLELTKYATMRMDCAFILLK